MRFAAEFDEKQVVKAAESAADTAAKPFGARFKAGIGTALSDFGNSATKLGKGMTRVGDSLTKNLTLPIVAAGGATAKLALDFDTTMHQIVGLAKVPKEQIAGVRQEILDMAGDIGRDPQELAEAFYFVASAGFEANEAMEVLRTSAKAAAAGMGETQDIAKVLGSVINAYGHDNLTAAHAADVLTAAVQDGSAEASDFASVLGTVAPGAAAMGVSIDQVTAAMAAMTNVGLSVEESAVSLNQVFVSLLKPTKDAEEAMHDLGLSSAGLRQELKEQGLLATLRTLQERFEGNDTAAAKVFGNIRALRGVTSLLSLDTDQLNAIFADTAGALGTLDKAYEDTEGPQRDLDRSMASLKATAIEIGEDVLPMVVQVLQEIAGGAKEFGKWWRSLDVTTRQNIIHWAAWFAVIGPGLVLLGKLVTGFGSLVKAGGWMIKNLPKVTTLLGSTTAGAVGLAAAIIALGAALQDFVADNLTNSMADAAGVGNDLADAQKRLGTTADNAAVTLARIADAAKKAGVSYDDAREGILGAAEAGKDWRKVLDDLEHGQVDFATNTADAMDKAVASQQRAANESRLAALDFAGGIGAVSDETKHAVQQMAQEAEDAAEDAHKAVLDEIKGLFSDLTTVLTSREQFDQEWQSFLDELEHPFSDTQRRMAIEAQLGSKAIREGLKSSDPKIKADTIAKVNGLIEQYNLLAPGALAAGQLVNPKMAKGISSNVRLAQTAAQQTAEKAGVALNQPDEWEAAGAGNIDAYIRGQQAHDEQVKHAAVQTAINGARAAANQKPAFRGAGFTAAGGFNEGIGGQEKNAYAAGTDLSRSGVQGVDSVNWYGSGNKAGADWAAGLKAARPYAEASGLSYAEAAARYMRLRSPAEAGPFSEDSAVWGKKLGARMAYGLRQAISDMAASATAFAASAANPLGGIRSPSFGALAPSLAAVSATSGITPTATAAVPGNVNNYYLTVEGKEPVVSTAAEIVREQNRMGRFG